ncbi:MAG: DUF2877 domain-containing protein [Anaerolineae bacterium]|nr:DUF2877 domain-containing protein [Anaerolineae bacterium]
MLHVFPRACNLIAADDMVIAVVAPDIGNGPFNVVVPPVNFTQHITPTDAVRVHDVRLHIGPLEIDLTDAAVWNPCPDWAQLRRQRDRVLAQVGVLEAVLRDYAPANSLAHLIVDLSAPQSALEVQVLRAAEQQWYGFTQGLRTLDHKMCLSSAAKMAGLGSGLTPAGDDWLLGCALAAQIAFSSPAAANMILHAVQCAAAHTSPLSAAWLRAAVDGACSRHWHVLFDRCARASEGDVYHAARDVLRQGHSSGADALGGFLAVLRCADESANTILD